MDSEDQNFNFINKYISKRDSVIFNATDYIALTGILQESLTWTLENKCFVVVFNDYFE